ncbi:hypothetical protein G9X67_00855 [Rhizobium sp. WYCCWR 11152]|uniref:hypothetical protein n=1 Tax=Rhizobium sp. WYCCWR 11152 TaxID=2692316 RepID=UPI001492E53A|nr:hypothetical protein [Rhizobium sp. WYCCWR 11152]NNU63833.1 hypothetical protein [Rhizobium sp. WYCCWR 11152]
MLNENAQTELVKTLSGRDVAQAGALCYRRTESGGLEILFVGSRRKTQWFPLKGAVRDAAQPGLRTLLSRVENLDL